MSSILNQDKANLMDLIPDKVYSVMIPGKWRIVGCFYSKEAAENYAGALAENYAGALDVIELEVSKYKFKV